MEQEARNRRERALDEVRCNDELSCQPRGNAVFPPAAAGNYGRPVIFLFSFSFFQFRLYHVVDLSGFFFFFNFVMKPNWRSVRNKDLAKFVAIMKV